MKTFIFFSIFVLKQEVFSQVIRPISLLNRQIGEIIEGQRFISEPPCNLVPNIPISVPNGPIVVPNTLIPNGLVPNGLVPSGLRPQSPECTPSVCQNLANTIQLMVVSNLIQNTQGSDKIASPFVNPLVKEIITSPILPCGCQNPVYNSNLVNQIALASNVMVPNRVVPNVVVPNGFGPKVLIPNGRGPNVVVPNGLGQNEPILSPKLVQNVADNLANARANSGILRNILQILGNGV